MLMNIMNNCSKKLMKHTVALNRNHLKKVKDVLSSILKNDIPNDPLIELKERMLTERKFYHCSQEKGDLQSTNVTSLLFFEKFKDVELFTENTVNKLKEIAKIEKSSLIGDVSIPTYEPINLTDAEIDTNIAS